MPSSKRNVSTEEQQTSNEAPSKERGVLTRSRRAALRSNRNTAASLTSSSEDDTSSSDSESAQGSDAEPEIEADVPKKAIKKGRSCQVLPSQRLSKGKGVFKGGKGFVDLKLECADLSPFKGAIPIHQPQKLKPAVARRLAHANTALMLATLPESLPCRDDEKSRIQHLLDDFFEQKTGRSMYICGVPGTGKTATTMEVVQRYKDYPNAKIVLLNCLSMATVGDIYPALHSSLFSTSAGKKTALAQLTAHFRETQDMTILILDEMDILLTKKSAELYNLFEWCWEETTSPHPKAEPLLKPFLPSEGVLCRRMGTNHLLFSPYSKEQMEWIVKQRLGELDVFHEVAIKRAAAKVSHVSGDIRRCLQLLQLSIDVFKRSTADKNEKITPHHVGEAIEEMYGNEILSDLGDTEKLILAAVLLSCRKQPDKSPSISAIELLQRVGDNARLSDLPCAHDAIILKAVRKLHAAGMVIIEDVHHRLFTHARLNIDENQLTNILAQVANLERVHTNIQLKKETLF